MIAEDRIERLREIAKLIYTEGVPSPLHEAQARLLHEALMVLAKECQFLREY